MNRDEIAQMMQDTAGAHWGTEAHFQRFAALVAAHEREACAKVCDAKVKDEYATGLIDHHEIGWTESCAFAIRARGEA